MTDLIELGRLLQETNATLELLRRDLASAPDSPALMASIRSVEKRQSSLEAAFHTEANTIGLEIMSYRLFGVSTRPKIAAIARTLGTFQSLYSSVYASLKRGAPLQIARLGAEDIEQSSFEFGYAYTGSVGFVFTVPNERRLFGESVLDESARTTFEMARAENPRVVAQYAARLGPAPVRAMYKWADAHASYNLGAALEWRREREIRSSLSIEPPQLAQLRQTIEETSDEWSEQVTLQAATLIGFQSERRTFELVPEGDAPRMRGVLSEGLVLTEPLRVPSLYRVALTKTTRTRYSMDIDEEEWVLNKIEEL